MLPDIDLAAGRLFAATANRDRASFSVRLELSSPAITTKLDDGGADQMRSPSRISECAFSPLTKVPFVDPRS